MPYTFAKTVTGPFLHLIWRPKVTGLENVPDKGGVILAANHLSFVDSIFLPLVVPRPVTYVAKNEYFTGNPLTAWFMRGANQMPVDRSGARAAQAVLDSALELILDGGVFGIYPEGTRSPDGRLYRGKIGVAWLAMSSGAPVVPVGIKGTDRVLPPGSRIPHLGRIDITIGDPLTFDGDPGNARARRTVTDKIMSEIQALSGQEYVSAYAASRKEGKSG